MGGSRIDRWMNKSLWRPLLVCLVFVAFGLAFAVWPEAFADEDAPPWSRYSARNLRSVGILVVVAFVGLGCVGVVRRIRTGRFTEEAGAFMLSGYVEVAEYERRRPSWECNDSYPDMSAAIQAATTWRLGAGTDSIVEVIELFGNTGRVRAVVDRHGLEMVP